jgi:hypothetical protein
MAGSVSPFRDRRAGIHDDAAEGKSQAVRMAEEVTLHPSLTAGTVAEPVTPSPSHLAIDPVACSATMRSTTAVVAEHNSLWVKLA